MASKPQTNNFILRFQIFICHRRVDQNPLVDELYEYLQRNLPTNVEIYYDKHKKAPGEDFSEKQSSIIFNAPIFLAAIGPEWENHFQKNIEANNTDWVREEIKYALKAKSQRLKLVIPIFVGNTSVPRADRLPEDIRKITHLEGIPFGIDHQTSHLIDSIWSTLGLPERRWDRLKRYGRNAASAAPALAYVLALGMLAYAAVFSNIKWTLDTSGRAPPPNPEREPTTVSSTAYCNAVIPITAENWQARYFPNSGGGEWAVVAGRTFGAQADAAGALQELKLKLPFIYAEVAPIQEGYGVAIGAGMSVAQADHLVGLSRGCGISQLVTRIRRSKP